MINYGWSNLNDLVLAPRTKLFSIFDQPNVTLEEILDHDGIIEDIRLHFNTASHFFQNNATFTSEMLTYVFNSENTSLSEKRSLIASEIFACEIPGVLENFFDEEKKKTPYEQEQIIKKNMDVEEESNAIQLVSFEKWNEEHKSEKSDDFEDFKKSTSEGNMEKSQRTNLMNRLFSVLKSEDISDCAAFYFKKILYALLNQKGFETIVYIYQNKEVLEDLFRNIPTNQTFAEMLYRVLLIDCCYAHMNDNLFVDKRKEIIFQIFEKFQRANFREDEFENYILILIEIMNNFPKGNNGKELLNALFDIHNFDILLGLFDSKDDEIIKNASIFFNSILAFKVNEMHNLNLGLNTETEKIELQSHHHLIFLFEKSIASLIRLVFNKSELEKFNVFGLTRLKIMECFNLFLSANLEECISGLRFYNFFTEILHLFEEHPNNNILHNLLYQILETAISINSSSLNYALFEEAKLDEFLIENLASYDPKSNTIKCKKPYFGHFLKLANLLTTDKFNSNSDLMKHLSKNEEWQEFTVSNLRKINEIHDIELGGHNPKKQKSLPKQVEKKEEIDDFDMLFIDNKKMNEKHSAMFENNYQETDLQDELTYSDLQNDLVNLEGNGNFCLKYQPEEEENLLDECQFDLISEQMSSLNIKNDV